MKTNQKGFTLIEIITTLIILGMLTAAAVPRYYNMVGQARRHAAMSAVAELQARVNTLFSKTLMANGGDCGAAQVFSSDLGELAGLGTPWRALIGVWHIDNYEVDPANHTQYTINNVNNYIENYDVPLNPPARIYLPICN